MIRRRRARGQRDVPLFPSVICHKISPFPRNLGYDTVDKIHMGSVERKFMTTRQEVFAALKDQPNLSVLVVGGGINGISAFRELALQGVDVLLVEKGDFCGGASAASSHMVHGGLRYLENGEFRLVQEALTERNRLLQNAPHYVRPLPTTVPIFKWFSGTLNAPLKFLGLLNKPAERGAFIIKIGLLMYDAYASTQRSMPTHHFASKEETLRRFPGIDQDVTLSATYYDAWMPYPERICLELVLDAEAANPRAHALNYTSVVQGADDTVTLRDELTGERHTLKPTLVINAAGPWIDFANNALNRPSAFIGGTKGSHIVLDHPQLREVLGDNEIFFENKDGRIVLIFPLEDRILAGTTDIRLDNPDDAVCTDAEIDYILELIQRIFPSLAVSREHIVFTFSGVRPLPSQAVASTGQISRDHSIELLPAGKGTTYPIYSLVGGKWTTFRAFGAEAADKALAALNVPRAFSTEDMPIGGGLNYPRTQAEQRRWVANVASEAGLPAERVQTLFERYGTRAHEVALFCGAAADTPLAHLDSYSRREVLFIVQTEKVYSVQDFILRRSLIAMLGKLTPALLEELTAVIGEALGWSADERAAQVGAAKDVLRRKYLVHLEEQSVGAPA